MLRTIPRIPLLLGVIALAPTSLASQGTPFKSEVDGLVRFFRNSTQPNRGLGDGTCLHTAMILSAMGHCHRAYTIQDGPYVRGPLGHLIRSRQADGSFADSGDANPVVTTLWVVDALRVIDPQGYAAEISAAERWLGTRTERTSAFADVIVDETALEAAAGILGRGVFTDTAGEPDMDTNVHTLVAMVRAQKGELASAALDERTTWSAAQQKGFDFLFKMQEEGKFYMTTPGGKIFDPGITGMGLAALLTKPATLRTDEERSAIDQGLDWLAGQQGETGGIGMHTINYTTCAAVLAMVKSGYPRFKGTIEKAQRYLVALQNTEGRDYEPSDRDYGSIGYGGDERGDLSNTQFAIEALRASGLEKDNEAFVKALTFLQRTQNLEEVNDFVGKLRDPATGEIQRVISGNDGGSAYYPGNSPAGYIELGDGSKIPRSYGSMTYALLKTYTLAGIAKDDPRVKAAVDWIQGNFDLDINPGSDPRMEEKVKYQGLYYYYMLMSQALAITETDKVSVSVTADKREEIDWRQALRTKLLSMQREDGGWLNERNGRWFEELDIICTTYALIALENCR